MKGLKLIAGLLIVATILVATSPALAVDCNENTISDDCDLDCGVSKGPCDVPGCGLSEDCNENDVPDECDIADLTSPDCNDNDTPDECEIDENSTAPGGPFYCTANCAPDWDWDGAPDECTYQHGERQILVLLTDNEGDECVFVEPPCNPCGFLGGCLYGSDLPNTNFGLLSDPEDAEPIFFDDRFPSSPPSDQTLNDWYREVSYDITRMGGKAVGYITIPSTLPEGVSGLAFAVEQACVPDFGGACTGEDITLVGPGEISGDYDHVFFYNNQLGPACVGASGGDWISCFLVGGTVTIHEFGHNLRLPHAGNWECPGLTWASGECFLSERGNQLSPMGALGFGHYDAVSKLQLGWIDDDQVITATDNSDCTSGSPCTLTPLEVVGGDKVLRIPIDVATAYIFEFRQPLGFDSDLLDELVDDGAASDVFDGLIGYVLAGPNAGILDMHPTFMFDDESPFDSPLAVTETYVDVANGIEITALAINGTGENAEIDIEVRFSSIVVDAGADVTMDYGGTSSLVQPSISGVTNYTCSWSPPEGVSDPDACDVTFSSLDETLYLLTVTDDDTPTAVPGGDWLRVTPDLANCDSDCIPDTCEDCNGNSIPDACDIFAETSLDLNGNRIPDECDIDCNANDTADVCDLYDETSDDDLPTNGDGIPDDCQSTIYVDDDCTAPGSGTQMDPFCTIQDAIDAADNWDIILVADGTYTGDENKNLGFDGKTLTLQSENGASGCVIDAEGDGRVFNFTGGEIPRASVRGFTIANGSVEFGKGGGIYIGDSSPTIEACVIVGNEAASGSGGGMAIVGSSSRPNIRNCVFAENSAVGVGGGISLHFGQLDVTNCTFYNNASGTGFFAGPGGAIGGGVAGNAIILNSLLWGNTDGDDDLQISLSGTPQLSQEGQEFIPGDVFIDYCNIEGGTQGIDVTIYEVEIGTHNIASDPLLEDPDGADDDPATWDDNDYSLSSSSPCINAGDPAYETQAGAVDMDGDARIQECRVDIGADESTYSAADCNTNTTADACDIAQSTSDDDNLNGVPDECETCTDDADCDDGLFCNGTETCNTTSSECESGTGESCSDCNDNDIPDSEDILEGTSDDCNGDGVPDECEIPVCCVLEGGLCTADCNDCNDNCVPDDCDIAIGSSTDCIIPLAHDCCEVHPPGCSDSTIESCVCAVDSFCCIVFWDSLCVGLFESEGCGSCSVAGNGVPDECEADCNENGEADSCDLADGTSVDCNGTGIPDECEDCSSDLDCDDCDACTADTCDVDTCAFTTRLYGDVTKDSSRNIVDLICASRVIFQDVTSCGGANISQDAVDLAPPITCGDSTLNIVDLLETARAIFQGAPDLCCFPGSVTITLVASDTTPDQGDEIFVEAFLDNDLGDSIFVHSADVDLNCSASGGTAGSIDTLIDAGGQACTGYVDETVCTIDCAGADLCILPATLECDPGVDCLDLVTGEVITSGVGFCEDTGLCVAVPLVDEADADYVFGCTSSTLTAVDDSCVDGVVGTAAAIDGGGPGSVCEVSDGASKYLGTFVFSVSNDAEGTFQIDLSSGSNIFALDASLNPITLVTLEGVEITVTSP